MRYDGQPLPDSTESRNEKTSEIDLLPPEAAVELFLNEEEAVLPAVRGATPAISRLIAAAMDRWRENGRLFYVGAGTSARIATVDAVSLTSTFGIPRERVRVLVAGGKAALAEAIGALPLPAI